MQTMQSLPSDRSRSMWKARSERIHFSARAFSFGRQVILRLPKSPFGKDWKSIQSTQRQISIWETHYGDAGRMRRVTYIFVEQSFLAVIRPRQ